MTAPIADLQQLLRTMTPVRHPGAFAFASVPAGTAVDAARIAATVREPEGLSVIMAREDALAAGLVPAFTCAWITLTVHSDLAAVGLTAAVSGALADAGISCNMVAGTCHDHVFVPIDRADEAMAVLRALQERSGARQPEG